MILGAKHNLDRVIGDVAQQRHQPIVAGAIATPSRLVQFKTLPKIVGIASGLDQFPDFN